MKNFNSAMRSNQYTNWDDVEFSDVHKRFGTFERIGTLDLANTGNMKSYILHGLIFVFLIAVSSVAILGVQ